jgi:hypothetical protein
MQQTEVENLANRIAQLISAESKTADLSSLQKGIQKINDRLDRIESGVSIPRPAIHIAQSSHPSLERFSIAEAIADEVFGKPQNEKACTFEPNGKPCDHCAMCSSRGF